MMGFESELTRDELSAIAHGLSGIALTDDEIDRLLLRFTRLRTSLAPVRALVGPQDEPGAGCVR